MSPFYGKERSFFSMVRLNFLLIYGVTTSKTVFAANYRYRSFMIKIIMARLVVMTLAMMMGQATSKMP